MLLLPQDLRELVAEEHLARHVSDMVDALELSAFNAPYEGDGRRRSPYDPRMMVTVLVYGYATVAFSSRKLARKVEEDIAFRLLAAGNFPGHRTLCEFRRRHLDDFGTVFAEVVRLARGMGLAGMGRVSVDGTKARANASRRKAMSYGRMLREERRLQAEIAELLERAEAVDAEEDARHGEDARGDALPEELERREGRLAAIRETKARLGPSREKDDARGRKPGRKRNPKAGCSCRREHGEPEEKAQGNFTDPESRVMKTSSEGCRQCCNPREPEKRGIDGCVAPAREGRAPARVDPEKYPSRATGWRRRRADDDTQGESGRRRCRSAGSGRRWAFDDSASAAPIGSAPGGPSCAWPSTSSGSTPSRRHEQGIVHLQKRAR